MSALMFIGRVVAAFIRSEFASEVGRHAVRAATAELVRQIQSRTRRKRGVPRIS
jgi:hypothetical protein